MENKPINKKQVKNLSLENELKLINLYETYSSILKNNDFITFEQLNASVLLSLGLGFESPVFIEFMNKINTALDNKQDIIFNNFVINFNIEQKFSPNILVPIIKENTSSTNLCVNLSTANEPNLDKFLNVLNSKINELLLSKCYIEIIPNTALFICNESNSLKLLFSPKILAKIEV
ncbi:DUF2714 domain-containing protein [Mycoplasma sp. ES3157-GEN-MYC]|uniref:DUF2714 domain-containing protein n=1 Tax=Mycoplasma miroungigenitalium TaxID=754515 RepID=A0A6M4JG51_9MOLU|nr:DUF2714 domain-containing protein [Mycoplasma miroungigenitalium]MBU4690543.1 DUF2714 domain-containing protein [Mycoplasma miroungigenitalium]MBU4691810.1 DUF2714 domain-containing protein [Mycoplasma miroungigenitalium]QJR43671.1 DUF2714 domain-containing protein [Mycoplasma miroungigenitalium]